MLTDYLLRRTRSVQIARSLLIAVVWVLAVMALVPAILVHDLYVGMAGFTLTLFFMGMAGAPLWTAAIDIAPDYAGTASALMNAAGAVAGILSPVAFGGSSSGPAAGRLRSRSPSVCCCSPSS